jgi:hypothetical protein
VAYKSQLAVIFTNTQIISNISKKIKWLQSEMFVLHFVNEVKRFTVHVSGETVKSNRPGGYAGDAEMGGTGEAGRGLKNSNPFSK